MDFAHRADDAGHEDFFDHAPRRRGMPLVAHLRRELRVFRGGLADEAGLPDVVGERLLAVDVLAVRQRQVGDKGVRMLGRGDNHSVEVVGTVEDVSEVGERFGLWIPPGRGVQRHLVHVAQDYYVLVWMRPCRAVGRRTAAPASPREGEFAQAGAAAPATGDERDVELIVQILAAQKGGRAGDDTGCQQCLADKLAPSYLARSRHIPVFIHGDAVEK